MKNNKSRTLLVFLLLLNMVSCCKESYENININANNIQVKNTYLFRNIGDAITINQQGYRIKCFLSDNIVQEILAFNKVKASLNYCEDNFIGLKKGPGVLSVPFQAPLKARPSND